MITLNSEIDLDRFMLRVSAAAQTILLLDYDGTLAPFRKQRLEAFPYTGVRERLISLIDLENCRTIIVSGRPVKEIRDLLDLDRYPEIWGCHGSERMTSEGDYITEGLPPEIINDLSEAADKARDEGLLNLCEQKYSSISLHLRGLPPEKINTYKSKAEKAWSNIIKKNNLTINEFDGGIEIRPPVITKGTAIDFILRDCESDVPVIYMGDDLTDEDAFRALKGRGLSILVKSECRPTEADIWMKPPDELLDFLALLIQIFGGTNEQ